MSKGFKTSGKRPRRSFTEEFKRDAVNLVAVEGYSFNRAAMAVGVSANSLRGWYEKYAPAPEACGADATFQQLQEELKRLRKKLREAEMEREILKKATAFFAKESQCPYLILETGRLDQTTSRLVFGDLHVPRSRRVEKRFLQMAEGRAGPGRSNRAGADYGLP